SLPRLVFVNKMDRDNASFERTLADLRSRFGNGLVPFTVPIGDAADFQGVVDLVSLQSYGAESGGGLPAATQALVDQHREALLEAAAESDDDLLARYLDGEEISADEVRRALREGVRAGRVVPVLCGSALALRGLEPLLDAIVEYFPAASEAHLLLADGQRVPVQEHDGLVALVFKTVSDPYIGRLNYFRVYCGSISSDSHVWNTTRGRDERIGQLYYLRGKQQEATSAVGAGDIGVVAKLQETHTGDTLGPRDQSFLLAAPRYPEPSYSVAIFPKTKADTEKLSAALARILEEDPSLRVHREASTGETILSGLGESHVDIAVERMSRKFGANLVVDVPKVPYRETITSTARAQGRFVRQTGGHGQYGVVVLEIEPLPRGADFEFVDKIVGGVVPKQYIPAVEKGVREAMQEGVVAGYPVVDVRVSLVDGKYHPVDSSEMAFKLAGSLGFKAAFQEARPVLLEPIMDVAITVPDEYTGDIMGDLNSRRAQVQGMEPQDGRTTVHARVPLAEMLRYATQLRSLTQGRGVFSMTFSHYEEVPAHIAQQIIDRRKKEMENHEGR
ncbi:MAG TPA: elongation factor G, partial [Chloroflexota bacterium]